MSQRFLPVPEGLSIRLAWTARHEFEPGRTHFVPTVGTPFVWHLLEGALQIDVAEASFRLGAGDWVWHPACGARRMEAGPRGAVWLSLGLTARCGGVEWFAPPRPLRLRPSDEESARGRMLLEWLSEREVRENRKPTPLETDGLARALMGWLWRVAEAPSRPHFPSWLDAALERIEREPEVSVSELSREAGFSPAQFRRLWEKHLGVAPRDFLLERRLERARQLLESSDQSVGQIAARCGFSGSATLGRAFASRVGMAPLEWRRTVRQKT